MGSASRKLRKCLREGAVSTAKQAIKDRALIKRLNSELEETRRRTRTPEEYAAEGAR